MILRKYNFCDCREIAGLFYDTVHSVCENDYTKDQLCAWADGNVDISAWDRSLSEHFTVVAEQNGVITGFGDIDTENGYLDRLYVHKDHQGKGIAAAICDLLENAADTPCITVYASITARLFFEKRGYIVVKENEVVRKGVCLTNYLMENRS